MSKLSNTDLFILIKSMTMSEKRNFKIYASRHVIGEENNYVALFDDIEKQKEYNEAALLADVRYKKHLPTLKTRLYETIMKSLDAFHSNSSVANKLNNQLHYVEILYKKGLYEQGEKIISKARPLALKYECFSQLIDIYNWEIKIMSVRSFVNLTPADIKKYYEKIFDNLSQLQTYFEYTQLSSLYGVQRAHSGVTRQNLEYYKELSNNTLYKSSSKATSFFALYHYYFGRGFYHFILGKYDKAYKEVKKTVELFKSNPHQIPEFPGLYGMALYNLAICESKNNNYAEALKQINEAKIASIEYPDMPANVYYLAASHELSIIRDLGQFEKGLKLVADIEDAMKNNLRSTLQSKSTEIFLFHNIAVLYFAAEKYNDAKKWINRILNENTQMREDLYCVDKILNLIIHYELGNNDLIEYLVKSSYRYLYKKKRLYEFESLILKFMQNKLPKANTEKDLQGLFIELKNQIEALFKKQPKDRSLLQLFDFLSWVNAKIENKAFAEVIKK